MQEVLLGARWSWVSLSQQGANENKIENAPWLLIQLGYQEKGTQEVNVASVILTTLPTKCQLVS